MDVRTTRFGELETIVVSDEAELTFAEGLPGFEEHTAFALMQDERLGPFGLLQSLVDPDVGFLVVEPAHFAEDYAFDLTDEDVARLELDESVAPLTLCILVIPGDVRTMTANLRAPIVVNPTRRLAKQVILADDRYPLRHSVFTPSGEWNNIDRDEDGGAADARP